MNFPPTLEAAQARLAAVDTTAYARTRNHLEGAVTRLSPYLTHGFLSLPQVLAGVRTRQSVPDNHKFVQELAWREFFHHVWRHEGDAIFESFHAGPLPDDAYARELPADIRTGATGVPVVDQAVRELYATGWLHNHARMWLASYVVHLRKVHWRAGADWLYGHLLDGDLASNHLSWQWVAGTGSHKPYLFNAENVARFAPRAWHSRGTPLDTSYEALDAMARSDRPVAVAGGEAVAEPVLWSEPPPGVLVLRRALPAGVQALHPWALGGERRDDGAAAGVFSAAFHKRWPWRAARWRFVAARMTALNAAPHWSETAPAQGVPSAPRLLAEPGERCASFSQFWARTGGRR